MYSVLIVDDERWIRASLKKVVERTELPFKVTHEASHGLEALDLIKQHDIDVIITDIRMPVMDGLQLVRSLTEKKKDTEIIIVSGHDEFHYAQQAVKLGVRDYLLKPVMVEDMYAILNKIKGYLIFQKEQTQKLAGETDKTQVPLGERSTIDQVIAYINSRMPGEVSLQETAAAVHLNPSYLSSLFKEQMKINFVDYVMNLTKVQLKQNSLSTRSISLCSFLFVNVL
jgi:YesN/AraC family two-component response regulator